MHKILAKIIAQKRQDLSPTNLNLYALKHPARGGVKESTNFKTAILKVAGTAIIGELKFASPTDSNIGSPAVLLIQAKRYEVAGIVAISVIIEKHFFQGDIDFIPQVKQVVKIPVLLKDFIIDESQIYQARGVGADAILLIARIVDEANLQSFVSIAKKINIEPVVEIANYDDLKKALQTKTDIIAVNARNLNTFAVDVDKACRLMEKVPGQYIKLGFSGIHSSKEMKQYKRAGAKGVLIGTALMKEKDITGFIQRLKV